MQAILLWVEIFGFLTWHGDFSWDFCNTQAKLKTIVIQFFFGGGGGGVLRGRGETRYIMVYVKMMNRVNAYPICDSPLWRSARRGAASLQKSRQNHRSYVRTDALSSVVFVPTQKLWYGLNIESEGSCKGSFVTRDSSSIVLEIEDYVLFVFLYKVGKPGCNSANLVDPNSQVLNVTNHLNCNSL